VIVINIKYKQMYTHIVKIKYVTIYKVLKYTFINVILLKFSGTKSPREDKIPSPSPNLFPGDFLLHPHLNKENFSIFKFQTAQSPRGSPFIHEIDIPNCVD
jgi:fucose permease